MTPTPALMCIADSSETSQSVIQDGGNKAREVLNKKWSEICSI